LLATLIFTKKLCCLLYILSLPFFCSAAEKDDQGGAFPSQVYSIAGAPVDPVFTNACKPLDIDVLPCSSRASGTVTFAADCASKWSNHLLKGIESSVRTYSTTFMAPIVTFMLPLCKMRPTAETQVLFFWTLINQ